MLNRTLIFITTMFVLTGATGLILQVAWKRDLTLIFGASHQAAAVVLAAFMGGLALGAWVWGRWAERIPNPLRWYGIAEIAVGVFAGLLPLLLWLIDGLYIAAAQTLEPTSVLLTGLRVFFCMLALLIPTFFMGGTLPLLVRTLNRERREFSSQLAWLYGMNTLGAVAGTLLAGFVLLPALGVSRTEWVAIGINLAVGVCAMGMDRSTRAISKPIRSTETIDDTTSPLLLRLVFYGTALCGFCSLAFEVLWTRALSIALGTTTYSFTIMLATFLAGIALGGLAYRARVLERLPLTGQFVAVLVALSATSVLACQWVPSIPEWSLWINQTVYGHFSGVRPLTGFLLCIAVMLPPATLFGLAFPIAARAHATLSKHVGHATGDSVSVNTIGAMLGALCAGFLMIPQLGMQSSMLLLALALGGYGLLVAGVWITSERQSTLVYCAYGTACLAWIAAPLSLPAWDLHRLGTFRNNAGETWLANRGNLDASALRSFSTLRYYREGRGSTVSVTQSPQMQAILIDGKTVATDSQQGLGLQKMMGHIPSLLHPEPKRSLVIGLGAGVTLGACTLHPTVESVRVVEIEPAVLDGAATFGLVNSHALDNPIVDVVIQDGRNYLRTTRERYDIITADPIHPWAAGSTYLFTREYYADARDRLADGGIMCQWLPLYELSLDNIRTMAASFLEVYPHVQLWQIYNDSILVGSMQPLPLSLGQLQSALAFPDVAADLRMIDVVDATTFLGLFITSDESLREFCTGAIINTDDNLHLEYATPYNVGSNTLPETIGALQPIRTFPPLAGDLPEDTRSEIATAQHIEEQLQLFLLDFDTYDVCSDEATARLNSIREPMPDFPRVQRVLSQIHVRCGSRKLQQGDRDGAVQELRRALEVFPTNGQAYSQLATLTAQDGDLDTAIRLADNAIVHAARSAEAWINRGAIQKAAGHPEDAEQSLQQALVVRPRYWMAHQQLGLIYEEQEKFDEAFVHYQAALDENPEAVQAAVRLARLYMDQGNPDAGLAVLHETEMHAPTNRMLLAAFVEAYRQQGNVSSVSYYETKLRTSGR